MKCLSGKCTKIAVVNLKYHFVETKSPWKLQFLQRHWRCTQDEEAQCGAVSGASRSCKLNIQSLLFHLCQWFPQPGFSGFRSANLLLSPSLAGPLGPALGMLQESQQLLKSEKACGWLNHLSHWFMDLQGHLFVACKWFSLDEKYKKRKCRWPLY